MENNEMIWKDRKHHLWFPLSFEKYRIEKNRLYCQHGFLRQSEHECHLYRILDISLNRSFSNRLCGTGSITLRTTDSSDPIIVLKNVKSPKAVKELLSDLIESERNRKGIIGRELLSSGMGGGMIDHDGDGDVDFDDYRF